MNLLLRSGFLATCLAVFAACATAQGKDLSGKDLQKADFHGKNLAGANLRGANLTLANLKEANLAGADLRDANLTSASLGGADLTGANLTGAKVYMASFQEAKLAKAILQGVSFEMASLFRAVLREANLQGATNLGDLRQADLAGADLRGADLTASSHYGLGETKLTGALFDANSRFPGAFDPGEAGMKEGPAPAAGGNPGNPDVGGAKTETPVGAKEAGPGAGPDGRGPQPAGKGEAGGGGGETAEPQPAADGELRPGQEVEILYGVNWLRGKVEKLNGDQVFVSWDGYHESQNSWVPRERVRPRRDPLAPIAKLTPPGGEISAVFVWSQVTAGGTKLLRYLFKTDGTFRTGNAFRRGEHRDFDEACQKFPGSAGIYRVNGSEMTMQYADGTVYKKELVGEGATLRPKGWQRAIPFPDGHKLNGSWAAEGGAALGDAGEGNVGQIWTFGTDGSLGMGEGSATVTGQGATVVGTRDEAHMAGTYRIRDFTLTYESGSHRRDYTIFLVGEETSATPKLIFMDEGTLKPVE